MKEYYLEIYDTHLSPAGNDFVMYRLMHIDQQKSLYNVFVT